ncbi:MAG TPA: M67 family metallopeptidase [Candidatus Xenobia bacterium]|nr:M67 family metallopeptidase [Candidatus Xenobia bacterium]
MALQINDTLLEEIRRHGARAYPNECCGALLGVLADNGDKQVRALLPLDNRRQGEAARTRFLITAEDMLQAMKQARAQGLDILGFYHSHPDHPARPSDYDREHAWPAYSYIIVGVAGGEPQEATSWVLADDRSRFDPEEMHTAE